MRLTMGYPSPADERRILTHLRREHPITQLAEVAFEAEEAESASAGIGLQPPAAG